MLAAAEVEVEVEVAVQVGVQGQQQRRSVSVPMKKIVVLGATSMKKHEQLFLMLGIVWKWKPCEKLQT